MKDARSRQEQTLPLSAEKRLDDVCQRFEAARKSGKGPPIEAYLGGAAGAERIALLKELIRLDAAYRRQRGGVVQSAEYLRRFPELDAAWLEREMAPATVSDAAPGASDTTAGAKPLRPAPAAGAAALQVPGYKIVRELGRGGMGIVYLAQNVKLDRREVLKVVNQTLLDRSGVAERFLREMRLAAKLDHPNVVKAYSAPEAGASLIFAMEYVDGYDLAKLVQRQGPLPIAQACHYVSQAAMALQHAHEKKLVHRDIKPHNLIVARLGKKHVVKILDFGLAKARREGEAVTDLTGEGAMMGTPAYMAPEQAQDAASADIRADIYSLGCTLYFLLTGAPPFTGKTVFAILQAHLSTEPPPLTRLRADAPAELTAVAAKMMAKDPGRRYQHPIEAAKALAPFLKAAATTTPAVPLPVAPPMPNPSPPPPARVDSPARPPRRESETPTVFPASPRPSLPRPAVVNATSRRSASGARLTLRVGCLALSVVVAACVGGVYLGILPSPTRDPPHLTPPVAPPPVDKDKGKPDDKDKVKAPEGFDENFHKAFEDGQALPVGWTGKNMVVLLDKDQVAHLEASAKQGDQYATAPPIALKDNFFIEGDFLLDQGQNLTVSLESQKSGAPLAVLITNGGQVALADNQPLNAQKFGRLKKNRFRIERKDKVVLVSVNNERVAVKRFDEVAAFDTIRVGLTAGMPAEGFGSLGTTAKLFRLAVGVLP